MFSELKMDMLKEMINIGMGEAASSLSELVNSRINIKVPEVRIMEVSEIPGFVLPEATTLGVYMSQGFRGLVEGTAILFYTEECSLALLASLFYGSSNITFLSDNARDTLQEVGNIILVSCISKIGDMLEMRTIFDIPNVTVETSETYFRNMLKELAGLDRAIVIKNEIEVADRNITGYLFILMGIKGFNILLEKLEQIAIKLTYSK